MGHRLIVLASGLFFALSEALSGLANDRIECFERSSIYGLSPKQKVSLCTGATSDAPLRCMEFLASLRLMSMDQRTNLCQGAASDAPMRCFENSLRVGLTF